MDILNFISWIKGGRYSTTIPTNAVTVVGIPNPNRDDKYLPVTVPVSAIAGSGGFTHYIGELFGGGIIVQVWKDSLGVEHGLVASLTNLAISLQWTVLAFQTTLIGATAQSYSDGLTNTDAIIAQAGGATTAYAAGMARLYLGGGFTDWYLPSQWELNACYNSANIVNKILGPTNGFASDYYWSSTEFNSTNAWLQIFDFGFQTNYSKSNNHGVRAVRTF